MLKKNYDFLINIKKSLKSSIDLAEFELNAFKKQSVKIIDWIKKNTDENTVDYRLPQNLIPKSYEIYLTPKLHPDFVFDGKVIIEAHVAHETDKIVLHADQLNIAQDNVTVVSYTDNSISYDILNLKSINYNKKYHFFTILLNDTIKKDFNVIVNITYSGILNTEMKGFYRSWYKTEEGEKR